MAKFDPYIRHVLTTLYDDNFVDEIIVVLDKCSDATKEIVLSFGAKIIERHITLDKSMWGTDQQTSIQPLGF